MSLNANERAVESAYDARAAEYVDVLGDISQMADADRALIAEWRATTTGPLVDAGCGPGHWTQYLWEMTPAGTDPSVLGVDLSAEFIAHARSRYPEATFRQGTIAELPCEDEALGGILAWYSLIHVPPEEVPRILREFARVIRPGGSILVAFFDGPSYVPFAHAVAPAYFWSPEDLADLLGDAGFACDPPRRRARDNGEASVRPHASFIARRR